MDANEQKARELLAAEYERDGRWKLANCLRDGETTCCSETAIRTISTALRSQGQADAVDDAMNSRACHAYSVALSNYGSGLQRRSAHEVAMRAALTAALAAHGKGG